MAKLFMGFLCLLFVFSEACGKPVSNASCAAIAIYREASSQSAEGQKAILEVIENLQQIEHKTACEIVRSSRFPWSAKQKSWIPNKEALTMLFRARMMLPVVGKGVVYFNNEPFKTFGRFAVKIEDHYFYYER